MIKKIVADSEEKTIILAKKIAHIAKKRDIFALCGTLGVGKSVFSRAFIQELTGVKDVPSPTFTLLQIYPYQDIEIYHFDLYRLEKPEEILELGIEDAFYNGISLIEWPQNAKEFLPQDVFWIDIEIDGSKRIFNIKTNSSEKAERLEQINE